jgi:hypothetical protein
MIAWLALALSLAMTGDLVIDLVFEEPDLSTTADASSMPEEPDNAAEHILMPSQKTDSPGGIAWPAWAWVAFEVILMSVCLPSLPSKRAAPLHERLPCSSPVPLLLPLRI